MEATQNPSPEEQEPAAVEQPVEPDNSPQAPVEAAEGETPTDAPAEPQSASPSPTEAPEADSEDAEQPATPEEAVSEPAQPDPEPIDEAQPQETEAATSSAPSADDSPPLSEQSVDVPEEGLPTDTGVKAGDLPVEAFQDPTHPQAPAGPSGGVRVPVGQVDFGGPASTTGGPITLAERLKESEPKLGYKNLALAIASTPRVAVYDKLAIAEQIATVFGIKERDQFINTATAVPLNH